MAEATISPELFLIFLTIIPFLLHYLCSQLFRLIVASTLIGSFVKTTRLCYHMGHPPKYQHRYHWFRARMKRKKHQRLRKPEPLLHSYDPGGTSIVLPRLPAATQYVCFVSKAPSPTALTKYRFDTDSFEIGIDTQCSRTMSGDMSHFQNLQAIPSYLQRKVGGIGGSLTAIATGDFVFKLADDKGVISTIRLPNSLYVPGLQFPLLCPQHWAQAAKDNTPTPKGTIIINSDTDCQLFWNQRRNCKTVSHSSRTNTPTFWTAPGTIAYTAFEAVFHIHDPTSYLQHVAYQVDANPAVEEIIAEEHFHKSRHSPVLEGAHELPAAAPALEWLPKHGHHIFASNEDTCHFHPTGNHKWGDCHKSRAYTDPSAPDLSSDNDKVELMRWHHRLGHLSFPQLQALAERGEIPKRLAKVKEIFCAGCVFGGMTRQPFRHKQHMHQKRRNIFLATKPGEVVSVDQLESNEIGFVAQAKGKLTHKRYKYATLFVDHFSRLKYIYFLEKISGLETLEAKRNFERFAAEHGVSIRHYHCDNGRFSEKLFMDSCAANNQRITFCGVNAHFQNGIAEKAIRDVTEAARKMLLHAKLRWPSAMDLSLWPYAMRYATYITNYTPICDGKSRIELFTNSDVGTSLKTFHTFGCPVFALNNELAAGNALPRWSPRARMGLNLGASPNHARNVNLVLNINTGLVSPQFHCKFDDFFETTRFNQAEASTAAPWRRQARLRPDEMDSNWKQMKTVCEAPVGSTDISESNSENVDALDKINDTNNQHSGSEGAKATDSIALSRTKRVNKQSKKMSESIESKAFWGNRNMHYRADRAIAPTPSNHDAFHDWYLEMAELMRHPIAFHAEMMGDIMYLNQALKQHDADEFVKAVIKEIDGHVNAKRWEVVKRDDIPEGHEALPSVWAMRRKRDLSTNEVTKHKARLNIHGGKQQFGVNYYDTYAPVVTWFAIRLMITHAVMFGWHLRQIDFVQAYPQAPIETDMYMELPQGIETRHGNSKDFVLKLVSNLYGQKQAGRVWNGYLVNKLINDCGFEVSTIDECVFYKDDVIFIVYVDDGIFIGKDDNKITQIIQQLRDAQLDIEDQGHPADYVGVNIKQSRDGTIDFTQRALIDTIIEECNVSGVYTKPVPAKSSLILHAFESSPDFDLNFNYRSIVGKLNYLTQTTRPDIMYAVHQVAKYSSCPKKEHGEAIIYIVRYLMRTRDVGLRFKPDQSKGFENYCDADFSGNWKHDIAEFDPNTAKSRSGWITFYAGCPLIWNSKLQTQVALSTTEAEYISLSQSLRDVIPIMDLLKEMKARGFEVICTNPHVFCKTFEDNSGALELARLPKIRPRTKHINVCYHHFREHVRKGMIKIFPIDTEDQIADALTKPLAQNAFCRHRKYMCGQ